MYTVKIKLKTALQGLAFGYFVIRSFDRQGNKGVLEPVEPPLGDSEASA